MTVSAGGTLHPGHEHIPNIRSVTLYVTGRKSDTAVLYLTDVFGIQLDENKLYENLPLNHRAHHESNNAKGWLIVLAALATSPSPRICSMGRPRLRTSTACQPST